MNQTGRIRVSGRYLNLPVRHGAPKRRVSFEVGGRKVREFEIELDGKRPRFWAFSDVSAFRDRELNVTVAGEEVGPDLIGAIAQDDAIRGEEDLYREKHRPQFHFSTRRGWINDPNGLVFYEGEYHLFYQHNPYGCGWGNMHWGHAVSPDLLHWQELPDAFEPDDLGTIFSGSAVVDQGNTAGFQSGAGKTLVCIYTSAGGTSEWSKGAPFTQSIAFSVDRGRTWIKHAMNPVLGHVRGRNRDPKVFYHEPTRRWVMALFMDGNDYALFGSPDLRRWEHLSDLRLPGASECPDLFELPVDGDPSDTRWVFWGGNGCYLVGTFDGSTFHPESDALPAEMGNNGYAAQTYSDIPAADGRRIQISWMKGGEYPGMPFNQQMSFPVELTLRTFPDGIRLCRRPIGEIERLRAGTRTWSNTILEAGQPFTPEVAGECLEVRAEVHPGGADAFGIRVRGLDLHYGVREGILSCLGKMADLGSAGGAVRLHLLVDRTSLEVFGDDGAVSMSFCFLPDEAVPVLSLNAEGGTAHVESLTVSGLRPIW